MNIEKEIHYGNHPKVIYEYMKEVVTKGLRVPPDLHLVMWPLALLIARPRFPLGIKL